MNFVVANIITDRDTLEWPNLPIVTLNLKNGGTVRVAVGLITTDTAHKTSPENINGLAFVHPICSPCRDCLSAKKEGKVDMVVL